MPIGHSAFYVLQALEVRKPTLCASAASAYHRGPQRRARRLPAGAIAGRGRRAERWGGGGGREREREEGGKEGETESMGRSGGIDKGARAMGR